MHRFARDERVRETMHPPAPMFIPISQRGTIMPTVTLTCVDEGHQGTTWQLQLNEDANRLLDPNGAVVAAFSRKEAERKIILPSSWEGVPQLGVVTDNGDIRHFSVAAASIQPIRAYLKVPADAVQAERVKAQGILITGIGATLIGVAIMYFYPPFGAETNIALSLAAIALVIYGIAEIVRGGLSLNKVR
ncbi:MAG: hypothetical protein ACK4XJ_12640 [Fimbriimonadaceae bacterium]